MGLLTKKEAAAELGITEENLDAWRWKGIGPDYVELPKGTRYSPEAIKEWIQARTRKPSVTEALAAR
jgi:hypothetical protein